MKTNRQTAKAFINGLFANGSNCFTDGKVFTSYSTAIASNEGSAILVADTYRVSSIYYCGPWWGTTPTTERQINHIYREAHTQGVQVFRVPYIIIKTDETHAENIKFIKSRAEAEREKARKARREDTRRRYEFTAGLFEAQIKMYKALFNIA